MCVKYLSALFLCSQAEPPISPDDVDPVITVVSNTAEQIDVCLALASLATMRPPTVPQLVRGTTDFYC